MNSVARCFSLCAVVVFAGGCSRQSTSQSPVVILAASETGRPQLDYSGPGSLSYRYSFDSFTFQIGPVTGTAWATAQCQMKFADSNRVAITIQSSSDRAYDIELLGVSTNRAVNVPEDKAKEKLHVAAGSKTLSIERFVIWTYDFSK
jgi:hypothetical protein